MAPCRGPGTPACGSLRTLARRRVDHGGGNGGPPDGGSVRDPESDCGLARGDLALSDHEPGRRVDDQFLSDAVGLGASDRDAGLTIEVCLLVGEFDARDACCGLVERGSEVGGHDAAAKGVSDPGECFPVTGTALPVGHCVDVAQECSGVPRQLLQVSERDCGRRSIEAATVGTEVLTLRPRRVGCGLFGSGPESLDDRLRFAYPHPRARLARRDR
jgi:hypothetical protein